MRTRGSVKKEEKLPFPRITFPKINILFLFVEITNLCVFVGIWHYKVPEALSLTFIREDSSSPVSDKGIKPIIRTPPSCPNYLAKAPSPNTIRIGDELGSDGI